MKKTSNLKDYESKKTVNSNTLIKIPMREINYEETRNALNVPHFEDHNIEFEQGADKVIVWMGLTGERNLTIGHFIHLRLRNDG